MTAERYPAVAEPRGRGAFRTLFAASIFFGLLVGGMALETRDMFSGNPTGPVCLTCHQSATSAAPDAGLQMLSAVLRT